MPFRRRIRRSIRRAFRARRWTSQLDQLTLVTNDPTIANAGFYAALLVQVGDYEQSPTLEPSGVTLARIRGGISLCPRIIGNQALFAWLFIVVIDEDAPVPIGGEFDPSIAQNAIDEDVLWWRSCAFSTDRHRCDLEWDIRAKRKLRASDVALVIRVNGFSGTDSVNITYNSRALLLGG